MAVVLGAAPEHTRAPLPQRRYQPECLEVDPVRDRIRARKATGPLPVVAVVDDHRVGQRTRRLKLRHATGPAVIPRDNDLRRPVTISHRAANPFRLVVTEYEHQIGGRVAENPINRSGDGSRLETLAVVAAPEFRSANLEDVPPPVDRSLAHREVEPQLPESVAEREGGARKPEAGHVLGREEPMADIRDQPHSGRIGLHVGTDIRWERRSQQVARNRQPEVENPQASRPTSVVFHTRPLNVGRGPQELRNVDRLRQILEVLPTLPAVLGSLQAENEEHVFRAGNWDRHPVDGDQPPPG